MKKIQMLAIALLFSLSGNAQNNDDLRFVEATGSARQTFVPDVIVMDFTLKENAWQRYPMVTVREMMLDKLLKDNGVIPEEQLYRKESPYNPRMVLPAVKGLDDPKEFELVVYDLRAAAAIFGALEDAVYAGIENVAIVRIDCKNKEEYLKNMRLKALENAREEAMAQASVKGKSVGSATLILEEDFYDYPDQGGTHHFIIPSMVAKKRDYLNDNGIKITYECRITSEFAVK